MRSRAFLALGVAPLTAAALAGVLVGSLLLAGFVAPLTAGAATSTHVPTATRAPTHTTVPTHTPAATRTRVPTATRAPTHTLVPTATPVASHTPAPTATRAPTHTLVPTHTRAPTHTPVATHTVDPNHTPGPTHTPRPTSTPRPTIVLELAPNRSANIVKAEPDAAHGAPTWLEVRWEDGRNAGYALAGFPIEGLNKSGVLTVSLMITTSATITYPIGFYVCKPDFPWDEEDTWNTVEAHCHSARVPFSATVPGTYVLDVTAITKASMWTENNGYQFR